MRKPIVISSPHDLTIPEAGSTTARDVLSRAIGRLMGELARIGDGPGAALDAAARDDLAAFQGTVRVALQRSPGALASALRRPEAGALLRCLRPGHTAQDNAAALLTELEATVLLELATGGALPRPVRLRCVPARIVALSARAIVALPGDAAALAFANGALTVERPGGATTISLDDLREGDAPGGVTITRPYRAIEGGIVLSLADNNPLAMREAHPDKAGNAVDLGGHDPEAWVAALRGALEPIARHLPALRGEIDLFLHQIVPVGFDPERHLSASYQEAIGTVYLSLHPSPMTLTEALIHEFSHTKLNALFELDEVLENAFSPLYASPVRPDPRPLHGVLLAVHAFLPVARLYELMLERGDPRAEPASFRERFARICAINREGAEVVLRHGRPTAVGRGVLEEIGRWVEHFERSAGQRSRG